VARQDIPNSGLFAVTPLTKIRRVNLKNAFLATAAGGAFLLIAACGGGDVSDGNGSSASSDNSNSASGGGGNASTSTVPGVSGPAPSNNSGGGGSTIQCQRLNETTFIGGNLFVAEQGPVVVTLLSDGGLGPVIFQNFNSFAGWFRILYNNVFGMQVSNSQDQFGFVTPFPPGTQVGASTQVQLQPPPQDVIREYGPAPSNFPKGIPLELTLTKPDATRGYLNSSTASIYKDIPDDEWHKPDSLDGRNTASVIYGPNNTATVTFFAGTDGLHFSVGLTNVFGTGCP
jgi:hypothetical protein